MVKLAPTFFAEAVQQMQRHKNFARSRLVVKLRPRDGTVMLKATDDHTTVTTVVRHAAELKVAEKVVQDYVQACTANAVAMTDAEAAKAGKKGKGKKK